ncbi:MAG: hypothetical protein DRI95_02985 [Bacteroidetes bacterium]|nr:MAG: hypothetical protein DRI95_02985 [Bacteroidota bacterium]
MNEKTLAIILISLFFFVKLKADDGAYTIGPQGGSIYPINNEYIQMLEELVVYNQTKGTFATTFLFTNTSDTVQKVTFGFPVWPSDAYGDYSDDIVNKSKQNQIDEIKKTLQFRTWIDKKLISRKLWATDTIDNYNFAFVTTVTFQPKETKTIVNKFKQGFGYGGDNMGRQWHDINYILKSGAGWKGVIKKAKIIFIMNSEENISLNSDTVVTDDFMGDYLSNNYMLINFRDGWSFSPNPSNIDYKQNIITWEFYDLEPDFDISLTNTENDFDYICDFAFLGYLDTLSSFIISNDTLKYNKYYENLKSKKGLFSVKKEYCEIFYNEYGKDFFKKHKLDEYSKLTNKIRHIINAYAALNNYEFSNKMWLKLFRLFVWYNPTTKSPIYDLEQINIIDSLTLFEKGEFYVPTIIVEKQDSSNKLGYKNEYENENSDEKTEKPDWSYLIIILFILSLITLLIFKKRKKPNA